jgi:DNA-binding MarR family transcriptional regulator/N-acetylglutamate synthase-like GNAT family acetyltransferase
MMTPMTQQAVAGRIEAVRRFNRFYTRRIGALRRGLAGSPFPLPEARVLYELAHREGATASEIGRDLGLDAGYMSRLLGGLRRRGLVRAQTAPGDARASRLSLTPKGAAAFGRLDARTREQIGAMLRDLPEPGQKRVVDAMGTLENLLDGSRLRGTVALRPPRPGDMGRVVQLHGELYAKEFGYDTTFEALVAEIVAGYVRRFDPSREQCWIAERDGTVVGSVFLVKQSKTVAKLRLLILAPEARGLGLGARLVSECIAFARQAGYRKLVLWTQSHLAAARNIYQAAGFRKLSSEKHRSFGKRLVAETWELSL